MIGIENAVTALTIYGSGVASLFLFRFKPRVRKTVQFSLLTYAVVCVVQVIVLSFRLAKLIFQKARVMGYYLFNDQILTLRHDKKHDS